MREWLVEVVRRIKEIGMAVENSKVLIIVNNWGIEETELTRPLRDLKAAGAKVTLAATTLEQGSKARRREGDAPRHYLGPV